jgi:hypothetical protein
VGNTLTNSIMRLDWTLFLELQIWEILLNYRWY